jgi:hypothetical protein
MNKPSHFASFKETQSQLMEEPILSQCIRVLKDPLYFSREGYLSPWAVRKLINSRDVKRLFEENILNKAQYEVHLATNIKYKPSSLIKPVEKKKAADYINIEELLLIADGEKITNIPIIEYDDYIFREKDWKIVLGTGVQGTVE